jgi:hypothetical protein
VDLDQYDQELLGTIMVRLCQCRCGGTVTPPLNESLSLFAEILRGAHVVVEDDRGSFYAWFTQMQVRRLLCLLDGLEGVAGGGVRGPGWTW